MKILLVDDDLSVRAYSAILLEAMGVGVITAASAAEAIEKLELDRPDGCIVDLVLGDGNGIAVAEIALAKGIPVVFASAVTDEHNVNQMLKLGWVLYKPVREPGLRRAMECFERAGRG